MTLNGCRGERRQEKDNSKNQNELQQQSRQKRKIYLPTAALAEEGLQLWANSRAEWAREL